MKNELLDKSLEVYLKIDFLLEQIENKGVNRTLSSIKVFDLMSLSLEKDIKTVNKMKKRKTYKQKDWK